MENTSEIYNRKYDLLGYAHRFQYHINRGKGIQ